MASNGEIAGVVAGGVVLFVAISLIPIIMMWRHRRKETARRASELAALREYSCMRQVGVQTWLEEQRRDTGECSRSNNNNVHDFGRYAQEPCAVCLSILLPSPPSQSSLPCSDPERTPQSTSDLGALGPPGPPSESSLLILNRCRHAFHYSCLTSWWEHRPYRCPVCQASYAPEE